VINARARAAILCLPFVAAITGGGCGQDAATSALPMPPVGYEVKWSTCAHFIEGDAPLLNNSRVVAVAADGTVPLQRVEPLADSSDNFRRMIVDKLPRKLLGGQGRTACEGRNAHGGKSVVTTTSALNAGGPLDPQPPAQISFIKLGQVIAAREANGEVVQWVVGSEQLGPPVKNDNGKLEYQDTCFRNPNVAGHDTLGYLPPDSILAASCLVEEMNQGFNAYSVYGYLPLVNYATMIIQTANDPALHALPDNLATYLGFDGVNHLYTGMGAALNDINGAERDLYTNYYAEDIYCHVIVSSGLEVPGAKRPATRSLPAPGAVIPGTYNVWRPVNPNVDIANDWEPGSRRIADPDAPAAPEPQPIEPEPMPADVPVDAADALVPM
jgi:hypothetical protein